MSARSRNHVPIVQSVASFVSILACLTVHAPGVAAQPEVTSVRGALRVGQNTLTLHSQVPENETVELQDDARCSVLLDATVLVQLSNRARVKFVRLEGSGPERPARIEIGRGELKATVGTGHVAGPLEIQTPAAMATLLGAIVHIAVDAETGDTIVRSLESQVRVHSSDPSKPGFAILNAGEQTTVRRGESIGEVRSFHRDALEKTSAWLDDRSFHSTAVNSDRQLFAGRDLEIVAEGDIPGQGLAIAKAPSTPSPLITALSKSGILDEVCDPLSCNPVYRSQPPNPCPPGSPPGKQCP